MHNLETLYNRVSYFFKYHMPTLLNFYPTLLTPVFIPIRPHTTVYCFCSVSTFDALYEDIGEWSVRSVMLTATLVSKGMKKTKLSFSSRVITHFEAHTVSSFSSLIRPTTLQLITKPRHLSQIFHLHMMTSIYTNYNKLLYTTL